MSSTVVNNEKPHLIMFCLTKNIMFFNNLYDYRLLSSIDFLLRQKFYNHQDALALNLRDVQ